MTEFKQNIGALVEFLYLGKVKLMDRSDGVGPQIYKWDVEGVEPPEDLEKFYNDNKGLLVVKLQQDLRAFRAELLSRTDWTQLADAPMSQELKAEYGAYREALRDVSKQPGFPNGLVVWPDVPGFVGLESDLSPLSGEKDKDRADDVVKAQRLGEAVPKTVEEEKLAAAEVI